MPTYGKSKTPYVQKTDRIDQYPTISLQLAKIVDAAYNNAKITTDDATRKSAAAALSKANTAAAKATANTKEINALKTSALKTTIKNGPSPFDPVFNLDTLEGQGIYIGEACKITQEPKLLTNWICTMYEINNTRVQILEGNTMKGNTVTGRVRLYRETKTGSWSELTKAKFVSYK